MSSRMKRSERVVYKFLEMNSESQISYVDLALELGLTEQTVIIAVRRLERLGRVSVERGRGRIPNRYRL
jgi:Mn-dependent DtxR family transcriptional regulator